jgi:hypothetical protein
MKKITAIFTSLALMMCSFVTHMQSAHASTSTSQVEFNQSGWDKNKSAVAKAAVASGVPIGELVSFFSIESGMKAGSKNIGGHSSAGGLGGMTAPTFRTLIREHHQKYGLSKNVSRFNAYANAAMTAEYIKQNRNLLRQALKRDITTSEVYMAHFIGPGTAIKVLQARGNRPITSVVSVSKGNARLFYNKGRPLTVAQFRASMDRKVANHSRVYKPTAVKYAVRYEQNQQLDALVAKLDAKPAPIGFSTAYVRNM